VPAPDDWWDTSAEPSGLSALIPQADRTQIGANDAGA
jgi:hypothetical protein